MQDIIANYINDYFGGFVFFCILIVLLGIFSIWWARGVYEKVKKIDHLPCTDHGEKLDELVRISSTVGTLPCAMHGEKLDTHNDKHSAIQTSIGKIETSIEFMKRNIDTINQNLQNINNGGSQLDPFTQRNSPLRITDIGYQVAERLDIFKMVQDNWIRIKLLIEENSQSLNPYDIQQFCLEQVTVYPEKFVQEEELNRLKIDAYKEGRPLGSYLNIIAVLVRDMYFDEKNISVDDIDKFDPELKSDSI